MCIELHGITEDHAGLQKRCILRGLEAEIDLFVIRGEQTVGRSELANQKIDFGVSRFADILKIQFAGLNGDVGLERLDRGWSNGLRR